MANKYASRDVIFNTYNLLGLEYACLPIDNTSLHRKQAKNFISYFCGQRKNKDSIFFNNCIDIPTTEQAFPYPYSSEQQHFWAMCEEQNTGGNAEGERYSKLLVSNEHFFLLYYHSR